MRVRGSPHAPGTPWVAQSLGATSCRIRRDVACCDLFLLKTGHSTFAITSHVCVGVCLPFTSDVVAVPLNCYCSRCHIVRQYGNVWATVRYVDRAVPSAPLTMHVACIILITVVTATHCGIIFDELLLRHADINIWKLRQSSIPSGNYPNISIIYVS